MLRKLNYSIIMWYLQLEYSVDEYLKCNWNEILKVCSNHIDLERLAARNFLLDLKTFLPSLHHLRSPFEVDINIQKFASDYCEGIGVISHSELFIYNNIDVSVRACYRRS